MNLSPVCRHIGFLAITFVPVNRFPWNFNTMILTTHNIKSGIENGGSSHTRLETRDPKDLKMVFFLMFYQLVNPPLYCSIEHLFSISHILKLYYPLGDTLTHMDLYNNSWDIMAQIICLYQQQKLTMHLQIVKMYKDKEVNKNVKNIFYQCAT